MTSGRSSTQRSKDAWRCLLKVANYITGNHTQLGNQPYGLDAMIQKEITENEGSTENEESSVWTDMNARLLRCIAQKEGML